MGFVYLQVKARRYVAVGPETYRRRDALGRPDADMDEEDLAVLMHGMKQLADGAGAEPDRPLTGIGIRGFNDLRHTLHLEFDAQAIVGETGTEFLDLMRCRHIVTEEVIELYNLVPRPILRDTIGAPGAIDD
ncbi:hypothetical protein JL101_029550 (plasmid) [Skermanella rosea]|uniref:hypothetical protein n=1 Tax=Skermanella rosea TaxID=1817965 RepID=UPI001931A961|nr:hypothetical protein [Skermanella rosea]UEM07143.1 hypothetical protein JL101_029550 [Skermanella rosea]